MVWGFYLASFLCAPNLPAHSISLCWRAAGHSPAHGIERTFQGQGEAAQFGFPEFPECFVHVFGTVLDRSKDGAGAVESPNSTPSSAQDLALSFPQVIPLLPLELGLIFPYFWGNKTKSFTPDSGRWAGLGAFPKETASLSPSVALLGLHIIPFSCPNLTTAVKLKNWEFLPLDLKYFVCVSLFLNLLWAVGTGQFCPVLLEFALHFWFKSIQLCPTNCPKIRL